MMNDLRKVAQEQSTDTKSAIGGTRMSEAATPAVAAGNRVSTTRIVGGAGVALAASVVVQNAMFTGAPTYAAPLGEVLAYFAENRGAVAVAVGLEAVNLPLLLLFVTGLHGLVQRRGGAGADWSRLAVAAAARRGGRQLAHLGRGRKPRHRGWLATAVRRGCGLSCVARLARCHRPTAHPWTGLTSLYGGAR